MATLPAHQTTAPSAGQSASPALQKLLGQLRLMRVRKSARAQPLHDLMKRPGHEMGRRAAAIENLNIKAILHGKKKAVSVRSLLGGGEDGGGLAGLQFGGELCAVRSRVGERRGGCRGRRLVGAHQEGARHEALRLRL